MFTVEQILAAHSKVKSGADFPNYVQDLIKIGVLYYETYVADGHTDYFGIGDYKTSSAPKYPPLIIAEQPNKKQFETDLKAHQHGKTSYPAFCNDSAKSGVEKWEVCMDSMTCTYYDKSGKKLITERIPE
jgi:uncharacterized protein YbcV (DUF1398 family)